MSKKALYIIIAVVGILISAGLILNVNGSLLKLIPAKKSITGSILFYGDGCPHCVNVEGFVQDNKVEERVKFTRLEVFHNQDNVQLLVQKAQGCKIDLSNGAPVPLYWDGSKCIVGDDDIINYFKTQINAK